MASLIPEKVYTGLATQSVGTVLLIASVGALLYWVLYLTYSLQVSPLAKIPGPKLAAVTRWVEIYHECFNRQGGRFAWAYRSWHDTYGPIIRVAPNEVHIRDSAFYDKLYQVKPQNKSARLFNRFDSKASIFDTTEHTLHARRRAVLEGFFSRKKISERAGQMQAHLDLLCTIVEREYVGTGAILSTEDMWSCWTSDVIAKYCFATSDDLITLPGFKSPLRDSLAGLLEPMHWITHFTILKLILFSLPQSLVLALHPDARSVINFKNGIFQQIRNERKNVSDSLEKGGNEHAKTIYGAILTSDLPPSEATDERLKDEGIGLLGAGTETTNRTLSIGLYYLWENTTAKRKLLEELKAAIPNPNEIPHWDTLSKLPYLSGCVNEALRLSYGASQRLIRVFDQPVTYGQYVIPPGTEVAMDTYDVCHDEDIFPQSHEFLPERWLADDGTTNNGNEPYGQPKRAPPSELSRYLVVFGRGPRACIGRHLAYAEACLGIATFVRRFEYEMYDTTRKNFAFERDLLAPRPFIGTPGIRMKVTGMLA